MSIARVALLLGITSALTRTEPEPLCVLRSVIDTEPSFASSSNRSSGARHPDVPAA